MKMKTRERNIWVGGMYPRAMTDIVHFLEDMGTSRWTQREYTARIDGEETYVTHIRFMADAVTYRYILKILRSSMDKKDFIMFG